MLGVWIEEIREFVEVLFECCNIYRRIYINKEDNRYEGRCPKCFNTVKVIICLEDTSSQLFKVD